MRPKIVFCYCFLLSMSSFLVLFLCNAASASALSQQCRGAGMPADAPLFYLELMTFDNALKARELVEEAFTGGPAAQSEQARKAQVEAATAKIPSLGTPTVRIGAKDAYERWEDFEIIVVLPIDGQQVQAAAAKRTTWPRQQRLDTEYHGEARNIILTDLNHDGITDFILKEDPHMDSVVNQLFLGCGDNFYTPLGFFIAGWNSDSGAAMTVRQSTITGILWDNFVVISPDLPEGKVHNSPSAPDLSPSSWAERVIAFDPATSVYREVSVKPLLPDGEKPR